MTHTQPDTINFKKLEEADIAIVKKIYDYYILNTTISFHTQPVTIDELKEFIPINQLLYPSYLILQASVPVGYCYLAQYKKRQAYDRTAEITLYLHHQHVQKGIGYTAINFLENHAKESGIKNLIATITGDNTGSIRLFENQQYLKCAHYKNVGEKFGKLLDVVAYQKEID